MESAFSWLADLIHWLVHWIPRLGICRSTHSGCKFVRGKKIREIKPGLFFWWPAVTEVEIMPVARQSINLPFQVLTTADSKTVLISSVVVLEIADIVKAIGHAWDVDETIAEIGNTAVVQVVSSRTFLQLQKELAGAVPKDLTKRLRKLLGPFGVRVIEGRLSDFARCEVFRTVGNGGGEAPDILPLR